MDFIWLCISSLLLITSVISGPNINTANIRVFPGLNQTVVGVFQVSSLNNLNEPQYAFNASEARKLCLSLGVTMASKAQVQEANRRGFETCRFGWIDEHFAVIPRIKALSNCGRSRTGLVPWRAPVTHKFDVFCFNETDAETQLKDTTSASPVSSSDHSETDSTQSTLSPSSPSTSSFMDNEAEPARYVGSAEGSAGAKTVLIASTCALLLIAVIVLTYLKLRRSCSDVEKQEESVTAEDWICVKTVKETEADVQEDERIEVDDSEN